MDFQMFVSSNEGFATAVVKQKDMYGYWNRVADVCAFPVEVLLPEYRRDTVIRTNGKAAYVRECSLDDAPMPAYEKFYMTTEPGGKGAAIAIYHGKLREQSYSFEYGQNMLPYKVGSGEVNLYQSQLAAEKDVPFAKIKRVSGDQRQSVWEGWIAQTVPDELLMAILYTAPI